MAGAGPSSGAAAAQARWELENNVQRDSEADAYYKYDQAELQALQQQRPWTKDPHYFKRCARAAACTHPPAARAPAQSAELAGPMGAPFMGPCPRPLHLPPPRPFYSC